MLYTFYTVVKSRLQTLNSKLETPNWKLMYQLPDDPCKLLFDDSH